eukprot:TRINITY_DN2639_c0_g1_i1.p1 TRINITY_DN2639_c0_g1~~TRINITY_DN2639_c0_g1_i1.p1  ORF type:complete len:804 (+),score=56.36 TRINITY_DN2639_c0_g1_i1:361-2772(+)
MVFYGVILIMIMILIFIFLHQVILLIHLMEIDISYMSIMVMVHSLKKLENVVLLLILDLHVMVLVLLVVIIIMMDGLIFMLINGINKVLLLMFFIPDSLKILVMECLNIQIFCWQNFYDYFYQQFDISLFICSLQLSEWIQGKILECVWVVFVFGSQNMSNCFEGIGATLVKTKNGIKNKLHCYSQRISGDKQDTKTDKLDTKNDSQPDLSLSLVSPCLRNNAPSSTNASIQELPNVTYNGDLCTLTINEETSAIELQLSNPKSPSLSFLPSFTPFQTKTPNELSIPLNEVLKAEYKPNVISGILCDSQTNVLQITTIKRVEKGNFLGEWKPYDLCIEIEDEILGQDFAQQVNQVVRQKFPERPRTLLVFINPYGGSKNARKRYTNTIQPLFDICDVQVKLIETKYQNHALEVLAEMDSDELFEFDGVIGVGGDGLFQEILNGILSRKDSNRFIMEKRIRVGQIPAGSTDCLAYSVNGTRSVVASTLHIVLGDRMPLDVMRIRNQNVENGPGSNQATKHVVCLAAYGFLGDVMRRSEYMRFLGQKRYDVAGFFTFLAGSSYKVRVEYIPEQSSHPHHHRVRSRCFSQCSLCGNQHTQDNKLTQKQQQCSREQPHQDKLQKQQKKPSGQQLTQRGEDLDTGDRVQSSDSEPGSNASSVTNSDTTISSPMEGGQKGEYQVIEGDYKMVMCAVTSCISDRSKSGLVPFAHTSDGRMHLILVPKMNPVKFLWFLSSMGRRGIDEEAFTSIKSIDVRAFRMVPIGKESSWNVDGELMTNNQVEGEVAQGLIDVFSRGVEVKSSKQKGL